MLLALVIGAGLAFAWARRFVQDDAFISFRYAEHFAHGQGLTWNVGEPPIEGFTNMLFVLLLAAAIRLGSDPIVASAAIGLVSFVLSLLATHKIAEGLLASRPLALACTLIVATNASFAAYATGGLETQLTTAFVMWALAFSLTEKKQPVLFAVASVLAVWTRLDAALLLAPAAVMLARDLARERAWPKLGASALVSVVGVGALLAIKMRVFGE